MEQIKNYFNKSERDSHLTAFVLAYQIDNWVKESKALSPDERKWLKTATTYFFKAHDSIWGRVANKYTRAFKNDMNANLKDITKMKDRDAFTVDDMLENLANSDVLLLSEYVRQGNCKTCNNTDFLACNAYHVFLRNNVECDETKTGCPYRGGN